MAVIPEVLLQRVIVNGFRELRKDPRLLDALFRDLSQNQQRDVKDFILDTNIEFSVNYPRDDLKLPSIVLLLKNETENAPLLGDSMTTNSTRRPTPGPDLSYDTLGGHGASQSGPHGLPVKLAGPLAVQSSVGGTLTLADSAEDVVDELLEEPVGCLFLYVVGGTGAGQVHTILRLRPDSLDIDGVFDPSLDGTSLIDIRVPDDQALPLGEPSQVYDAAATNVRRRGSYYETTYHLQICAAQQEQVVYLYSVIKALLISQRPLLEAQGMLGLKISGSDFSPRGEYLPTEAFQRNMVMTFTYPFSFLEEFEVASGFRLLVTPDDPQTLDPGCDTAFGPIIVL